MSEIQKKINSGEILGKELILDLHDCDTSKFGKEDLEKFLWDLCEFINMNGVQVHTWQYLEDANRDKESMEHLAGHSMVLFLMTSNITLHSFDNLKRINLNIYSCKDFDCVEAVKYCAEHFRGNIRNCNEVLRY